MSPACANSGHGCPNCGSTSSCSTGRRLGTTVRRRRATSSTWASGASSSKQPSSYRRASVVTLPPSLPSIQLESSTSCVPCLAASARPVAYWNIWLPRPPESWTTIIRPVSVRSWAVGSEIGTSSTGVAAKQPAGERFEKLRPADGRCSAPSRARARPTSRLRSRAAAQRAACSGRRGRPSSAARSCASSRSRCGRGARRLRRSSRRRRGSRSSSRSAKTDAAVEMGFFVAGEGRRLYGRTTTSAMPNRTVMATRRPVGVAGLIVSFNTPLPNYAWKAFPAVFCGNAAVLKPSEHTPASAAFFGELCHELLPPGVLNVVHGLGPEAGPPLVESRRRRPRQLHGLGGDRTLDRGTRRAPAGEGRARARREERARRLRRRRPRPRRRVVARVGVLECGAALCRGEPRRRVRLGLRRVPRTVRRGRAQLRDRAGDQRGEPRAHPRARSTARTSRSAASGSIGPGWWLAPTVVEDVRGRRGALPHGALRPGRDPLSRARPRGGDRTRQRLAVRADVGDPHGEPASRDALRRRGRGRAWSS